MARGLILAAPSSGSGKTSLTFGLLAALRAEGTLAQGFKTGPDYIDPQFHRIAAGRPCPNLDPWAMRPQTVFDTLQHGSVGADLCLIEGVMGLFDGVPGPVGTRDTTDTTGTTGTVGMGGNASTASLAKSLDLPVVLIVDAKGQSQSVAALVRGFADFDPGLHLAGVILNRVGSDRHRALLSEALATHVPQVPVLGAVPRLPWLEWPGRHLGLTLPDELPDMPAQADRLAQLLPDCIDLDALQRAAGPLPDRPRATDRLPTSALATDPGLLFPAGAQVAIARDEAFSFVYPHWLGSGEARVETFSPLANEAVPDGCDFIFLPGGYPELHAGRLATANVFLASLREHHARATPIYGECGGYMVLGQAMTVNGTRHAMAGLLPVVTHYSDGAARRLGYRSITAPEDFWAGPRLKGHEFHASTAEELEPANLFSAWDSSDKNLGRQGHRNGNTLGSYLHIIDRA